jgi:hypothetical protein
MSQPIVALPVAGSVALRPELWIAVGIAGYNHALLTKRPLRILSPQELIADEINEERWEKLNQGLAALADASQMTPGMLAAALAITRSLLEPLGVEVSIIGNVQTRRYLLLESKKGMHERKPAEGDPLRILPVHDYPASAGGEPSAIANSTDQCEQAEPQSTGARRTGGVD